MSDNEAFDPLAALNALAAADVAFVVIGGVAARLHGSPSLTRDLDICYDRTDANLERLAKVLSGLEARLRGVDEVVPFLLDARTLKAGGNFTFVTTAGDIDILAVPAGVSGFDDLASSAPEIDFGDVRIKIAALADLIRMKRAAGRPKDLIEVEVLSALRDELDDHAPRE